MKLDGTPPQNEIERLQALRRYQILDTPPDAMFDHLTEVITDLFRVPIALVSLVDQDRIWFKSHRGLEASEIGREPGLCASTILSPEVYHISDAMADARTRTHAFVSQRSAAPRPYFSATT
jgi:GAF domain-containing protein